MSTTTTKKKPQVPRTRRERTERKRCAGPCGRRLPLFASFRPRWRGCAEHALPSGRRQFVEGCRDCEAILTSRTRQPRCRDCDKERLAQRSRREKRLAVVTELALLRQAIGRRTG